MKERQPLSIRHMKIVPTIMMESLLPSTKHMHTTKENQLKNIRHTTRMSIMKMKLLNNTKPMSISRERLKLSIKLISITMSMQLMIKITWSIT